MGENASMMVSDPDTFYMCSSSRLPVVAGKLVELQDLERGIAQSIADVQSAKNSSEWARAALFGLRITKAACDATVSVMGEFVPGGEKISDAYSAASPSADLLGKFTAGEKVSGGDVTKAVTAGALAVVKKKVGDSPLGDVAELKKIQSDLVVDALNQETDSVIKDLTDNMAKIGKMAANYAKKKTLGKLLSAGKALLNAGYDLAKGYREYKDNDMRETLGHTEQFLKNKLSQVRQSIAAVQQAIFAWEQEQAQKLADNEAKASMPRIGAGR